MDLYTFPDGAIKYLSTLEPSCLWISLIIKSCGMPLAISMLVGGRIWHLGSGRTANDTVLSFWRLWTASNAFKTSETNVLGMVCGVFECFNGRIQ